MAKQPKNESSLFFIIIIFNCFLWFRSFPIAPQIHHLNNSPFRDNEPNHTPAHTLPGRQPLISFLIFHPQFYLLVHHPYRDIGVGHAGFVDIIFMTGNTALSFVGAKPYGKPVGVQGSNSIPDIITGASGQTF